METGASSQSDLLPRGAGIGRYTVLGLVGRGAMGDVYAAYDPQLGRKVALKLVRTRPAHGPSNTEGRVRLLREAQAIAKLSHPNIVVVHDVGTFEDNVFLAMEFVEGHTLSAWLLAGRRTHTEILALYGAAGRGLEAAHKAGIVHRDFKPDNVMVSKEGLVRVMDFGLARQVSPAHAPGGEAAAATAPSPRDRDEVAMASRYAGPAEDEDVVATVQLAPPPGDAGAAGAARSVAIQPEQSQPSEPTEPAGAREASDVEGYDERLTRTGAVLGTPAYMAPEQFLRRASDARTDQFSFCVALYEALYRQRPFEGTTFAALMASVVTGAVVEPPRDSKVPASIRRALRRGLSVNPEARWPSMTALLAALAYDPARRWRRTIAAGGVALSVLLAATTAANWRAAHGPPPVCRAANEKLGAVWDADDADTPRKTAVSRAFLRTNKPFAAETLRAVRRTLDRYALDWKRMYEETCQATHVRGDQSAEIMDLRMACLQERLVRMRALVDVFADADGTVVENAATAAGALPSLDRCADVPLLRTVVALPDGAAARERVSELRRRIARMEARANAGQCGTDIESGQDLLRDVRQLGYGPLEAEALNGLAGMGASCLDPGESVRRYKQGLRAAIASRDDDAAVTSALATARILAETPAAAGEARDLLELGRAILASARGSHPLLEWRALAIDGAVAAREGDGKRAVEQLTRALAAGEKLLGPDNLEIAAVLANVGTALEAADRLEESVTYFDRARRLTAELLGPGHPLVAVHLVNRSAALNALGLHAEALADARAAVDIWKGAGASPVRVAAGLTRMGESLLALGRPLEATPLLEEAARDQTSSRTSALPDTRFALARALWQGGTQRNRALALAEEASGQYRRAGGDERELARVDAWLAAHSEHD